MLKQRVMTGLLLIAFIGSGTVLLPNFWFSALVFAVVLYGAWEWSRITIGKAYPPRVVYLLVMCVVGGVLYYRVLPGVGAEVVFTLMGIAWLLVLGLLSLYPQFAAGRSWLHWSLPVLGIVLLNGYWLSVSVLHRQDWQWVFYLFTLVALADTAAYFVGKRYGRSKLAPILSPGKTRAGLWGALVSTGLLGLVGAWWFGFEWISWPYFVGLTVLSALFSVAGDLFESLMKREAGVKDSGYLLPGHGGVLDRIDGFLAASPIFALGLLWM